MIVFSNESRVVSYKDKFNILPGSNLIKDEELGKKMKADEWLSNFRLRFKSDSSSESSSVERTDSETVLSMKAKDAIEFLKDSADIELLREVADKSDRASVAKAAEKQIAKLEEGREDEDNKEE